MLTFMVQFGVRASEARSSDMLEPLLMLLGGACAGLIVVSLLTVIVRRGRVVIRTRRGRRRRKRLALRAEERARAQMSELCPNGWRAQITLLERADEDRRRASDGRRIQVALDWAELEDPSGRPVVLRRVWAPTIAEALDAMVADRRTDETLERIEQGAMADGARWPEL